MFYTLLLLGLLATLALAADKSESVGNGKIYFDFDTTVGNTGNQFVERFNVEDEVGRVVGYGSQHCGQYDESHEFAQCTVVLTIRDWHDMEGEILGETTYYESSPGRKRTHTPSVNGYHFYIVGGNGDFSAMRTLTGERIDLRTESDGRVSLDLDDYSSELSITTSSSS